MRATATHTYTDKGALRVESVPCSFKRPMGLLVTHPDLCDAETIAVIRDGHLGDLFMLSAVLRELHLNYPHLKITLFSDERWVEMQMFKGIPFFSHRRLQEYAPWDHHLSVDLRSFVERHPSHMEENRQVLFASAFGLKLLDGRPEYRVLPGEREYARGWLDDQGWDGKTPLIAFGPIASDQRRTMTGDQIVTFGGMLGRYGKVVSIHRGPELRSILDPETTLFADDIEFRIQCAILEQCLLSVVVDSGVAHMSQAVQRQLHPFTIVLMSMIPARLRYSLYKNTVGLDPSGEKCFPCGDFGGTACNLSCMKEHTTERVEKIVKLLIERNGDAAR